MIDRERKMKTTPILFSGEMIRALLDGRKSQTRRVITPQPNPDARHPDGVLSHAGKLFFDTPVPGWDRGVTREKIKVKYQPGDLLWCRETWRQAYPKTSYSDGIIYRADRSRALGMQEYADHHRWKPSVHMERQHSRLTLKLTDVRVERLHSITAEDCVAEGVNFEIHDQFEWNDTGYLAACDEIRAFHAYEAFWDSLSADYPWESNPWVWRLSFSVIQKNVDEYLREAA